MDWQNPEALYLILPLCLGWLAIAIYSQGRRQRASRLFVARQMADRILPEPSPLRFWCKLLLREVAIVSGLVAIAGPRFGEQIEQIIPRGSDLYVLIDVSRSMLADDVLPSRLGRAKADVSSLVNRLEGERIGLIAFAGQAVVKCPLTVDYTSFRRSLNELDPNSAPRGGTAIGDAIRKSLEVFQANSDRDQAILLITDGDDQQSYPLDAAGVAAERQVTIFTVGLGDSVQGARIPVKDKAGLFIEHQGEQVWSKLDGNLLQEIALKTSGVFIPAGTRSYDLGELYTQYLQGRKGDDSNNQTRIRRAERFQIFLAIAWIALMFDLWIVPFRRSCQLAMSGGTGGQGIRIESTKPVSAAAGLLVACCAASYGLSAIADDSVSKVREGMQYYSEQKFDEAVNAFRTASEQLEKDKSPKAAIAIFDEACTLHRKGDFDRAKEKYLEAGLSQERGLATASHFNLGMLASEQARVKAGDHPEAATSDQRQEILAALKQAIASYRHCLELDPKHMPSRKNLEIVRQWIKYYSDKWSELDRQKRRDETDLLKFLEFLIQAEESVQNSVQSLPANASSDRFAELKQVQDELAQEIPVLKDKIGSELRPKQDPSNPPPSTSTSDPNLEELEKGIKLLQEWAGNAGNSMKKASDSLSRFDAKSTSLEQKAASTELDRIWEAIVNFHALLSKELNAQGAIADSLGVSNGSESKDDSRLPVLEDKSVSEDKPVSEDNPDPANARPIETEPGSTPQLEVDSLDWDAMFAAQETALRRARLLAPKAEAELNRMESEPQQDSSTPIAPAVPQPQSPNEVSQDNAQQPKQVDPEEVKQGYRKAMELAPRAVDEMTSACEQLKKRERMTASQHAREAKRILQEIQDAQPKNPQQDQQNNQDDQNKDEKNQENQGQDPDKKEENKEEKKDENKDSQKEQQDKKQDDSENKDQPQSKDQQPSKPNPVSKDRIEEALRKVREREQEKRDRDRELRARVLGRTPVDKDW